MRDVFAEMDVDAVARWATVQGVEIPEGLSDPERVEAAHAASDAAWVAAGLPVGTVTRARFMDTPWARYPVKVAAAAEEVLSVSVGEVLAVDLVAEPVRSKVGEGKL